MVAGIIECMNIVTLQESSSCPRVNKLGNLVTLLDTASTLPVNKPVSNTCEIVFLSKQCPRVLQKCPSLDTLGHELLSCCVISPTCT